MGKAWKNTIKSANAAKKGMAFTKAAKEIQVATKLGGPHPESNPRLRMAIEAAKKISCPNDTIERAIKKGSGQLEANQIEEITYEGYGPHGVGVIVETQTDNKNRTAPEVRLMFKKHEGSMGETGSVLWMFDRVGLIDATKDGNFDPEEEAIEAGANEVEKTEEGYTFFTDITALDSARQVLAARGWKISACEPGYKPKNITSLTEEQLKDVYEFLNEVDEHDDTHRVYATIKV